MSLHQIKTFKEFQQELNNSTELQKEFKNDPVSAVNKINAKNPLSSDVWIYRIIVLALGIVIISIVLGVILLISSGKITDDTKVPTILTAIGSAAIGALAGLLAPPPNKL